MIDLILALIRTADPLTLAFYCFWLALFIASPVVWWLEMRALKKWF